MKFHRAWSVAATLTLALGGAAYAYRAYHPVTVAPADPATASALLAELRPAAADPASAVPVARTVWRSRDNTRGVEFVLSEGSNGYIASFESFDPPPAYASHLTNPTVPAFGWIEVEVAGITTRYSMANVGGTLITRCDVPFHLGVTLTVAAWKDGTDWNDQDQAFFWMDVPVLVQ